MKLRFGVTAYVRIALLCLVFAAGITASVAYASPDDTPPGVALPATPVTGTVDASTDPLDVFHVHLDEGQYIDMDLNRVPFEADEMVMGIAVFPPGTTDVSDLSAAIAKGTTSVGYTALRVGAPAGGAGDYVIAIRAISTEGTYHLNWHTWFPVLHADSTSVTLGGALGESRSNTQTVTVRTYSDPPATPWTATADVDWLILSPTSSTQYPAEIAVAADLNGKRGGGTYTGHITVSCLGAEPQVITVKLFVATILGYPDVPGMMPLVWASVPYSGSQRVDLKADDPAMANYVTSLHLDVGQEFNVVVNRALWDPAWGDPGDPDILLFPPGTTSIYVTQPVAHSTFADYWPDEAHRPECLPEHLSFVARTEGDYYLVVRLKSGGGDGTLGWSYDVSYAVWQSGDDDQAPGLEAGASPVGGELDNLLDPDDYFQFALKPKEQLQVCATTTEIDDLNIALWNPLARVDPDLSEAFLYEASPGSEPSWVYASRGSNTPASQWLQVHARSGQGHYQLWWGIYHEPIVSLSYSDEAKPIAYLGSLTLSGHVTDDYSGSQVGGAPVELWSATGSTWESSAETTTDATGEYSFLVRPKVGTEYYVSAGYHPTELPGGGHGQLGFTESEGSVYVWPKAYLSRPYAPSHAHKGRSFTSWGYLKPGHAAGTYPVAYIDAYRYEKGRWVYRSYYKMKAYNYSTYTKYKGSVALPSTGKWKLRAFHGDEGHYASTSSWRYVTVY